MTDPVHGARQIEALKQRITELESALEKYGKHEILCDISQELGHQPGYKTIVPKGGVKCTCGLEQALKEKGNERS